MQPPHQGGQLGEETAQTHMNNPSRLASPGRIIQEYEAWLRSWGAAENTIKARIKIARSRLLAWGGLQGFTAENAAAFLGRDISAWSRSAYHSNLKDFCDWLVATDQLEESPMDQLRKPRRPKSRPRPLSEPEVARCLMSASNRTRDFMVLALCAGLRAHEIAKIRGEHVSEEGIYVEGKGGSVEILPCHPDIWAMAQRYPRQGYWFTNRYGGPVTPDTVTMSVGRVFRSLGIEGSVHRLRHVYGTRLLRAGVNIRKVQTLMRHATLETTAVYTAVDEDELRAAIYGLPSSTEPPPAA